MLKTLFIFDQFRMILMDNRLLLNWSPYEASCLPYLELKSSKIYFVIYMEKYISMVMCYKKICYELIISNSLGKQSFCIWHVSSYKSLFWEWMVDKTLHRHTQSCFGHWGSNVTWMNRPSQKYKLIGKCT